jgi:hypothetical protein
MKTVLSILTKRRPFSAKLKELLSVPCVSCKRQLRQATNPLKIASASNTKVMKNYSFVKIVSREFAKNV